MKGFNKILVKYLPIIAMGVTILTLALLFIPQSFLRFNVIKQYSGVEALFYFSWDKNYLVENSHGNGTPIVIGIIAMVLMILSAPLYALSKKSSAALLLGSILTAIGAIIFLTMELWIKSIYKGSGSAYFMPYIIGGLLLVTGGFGIYTSIVRLLEEKNAPVKSSTKSYSYLKK